MPKNRPKLTRMTQIRLIIYYLIFSTTERTRTISIDSTSSGTDMEAPQSPTPIETAPHRRRSISEMLAFAYPIQQKTQTIGTKTDVSTYIGNDNQPIVFFISIIHFKKQNICGDFF